MDKKKISRSVRCSNISFPIDYVEACVKYEHFLIAPVLVEGKILIVLLLESNKKLIFEREILTKYTPVKQRIFVGFLWSYTFQIT